MRILTKMSCSYSDNRLIFPDNASPHAMKDATGVPPDRLCIYVSRAWRKCKAPQSEGAHETTCGILQLSRWDASDSHLISLTLLHVQSSRRALAHSILLHFPSLLPYYNILVFYFLMYSCGREYIYTWIGVYVYTWIQLETLIPWWVAGLYRFAFL